MIRRAASLTYSSELLVDVSNNEKRQWVRDARDAFETYLAEEAIGSLLANALFNGITVRTWTFAKADAFLSDTDAGRAFAERVATEMAQS